MSMRSPLAYVVPDETARVARAVFPKGNLYMEMQAELGMLYTNHQFASFFSTTGDMRPMVWSTQNVSLEPRIARPGSHCQPRGTGLQMNSNGVCRFGTQKM